jgi:hypothetical protein
MRTIMFPLEDCGKATIKMEETQKKSKINKIK